MAAAVASPGGVRRLLQPTVVITLFTLVAQAIAFVTQLVIAAAFGTGAEMDAFLAASTLPQYLLSVALNALSFVFVPVFLDHAKQGREDEAWRLASATLTLCTVALGTLSLVGIVLAEPLLRWTTPGLPSASLHLAARVAMITWPAVVATGIASLLTAIYHSHGRFGWPAAVPVLGAVLNLALVAALARRVGVVGIALAALVSLVLQILLLLPIATRERRFRPVFNWRDPGVLEVLHLLLPLVLANLLVRWTPIIDRYLASGLAEGAISQLGYALKVVTILSTLLASGITTVVFPRMASDRARGDLSGLRETISLGLRFMWLGVAPVMTIGLALAFPLVSVLFRRGEFSSGDAQAVAGLLQVYLLALVSMCLGNVTSRAFYALKDTRTVGVVGAVEALAYVVYAPLLAHRYGAAGIAASFVIYFNSSLVWLLLVVRHKAGGVAGWGVLTSFTRTGLAALVAGGIAYAVARGLTGAWAQLVVAGGVGVLSYAAGLMALGSLEARTVWQGLLRGGGGSKTEVVAR